MKESLVATDLKGITDPGVQAPQLFTLPPYDGVSVFTKIAQIDSRLVSELFLHQIVEKGEN